MGTQKFKRLFFTLTFMALLCAGNFNLMNQNFSFLTPSIALAEEKDSYRPHKVQDGNSDEAPNPFSHPKVAQAGNTNATEGTLESGNFMITFVGNPQSLPDLSYKVWSGQASEAIPAGAHVTRVQYYAIIYDQGDPSQFYCGDYEIWLASGPLFSWELPVYDNRGGRTDGGYDDDSEDDSDIEIHWRTSNHFNGEDPRQKWYMAIKDNRVFNSGRVNNLFVWVYWESPCEITVTSPNGGETWTAGSTHTIRWTSTGTNGEVRLHYSTNGGSSWTIIVANTTDDGAYSWTLPEDIESDQCRVRVMDGDNSNCRDESDANFTIIPPCEITVTSPNGDETWEAGSTHPIRWTSSGTSGEVWLRYSTNGGASWIHIAYTADDGLYTWTLPEDVESTQCRVRISDRNNSNCQDESDASFTITPACEITVTSPNGGETWEAGSTHTIRWTSNGTSGNVKIQYTTVYGDIMFWNDIVTSTSDDGAYSWHIPRSIDSDKCRVRVSDVTDYSGCYDISDNNFTIEPDCQITVTSPNGGETWEAGTTKNITWTSDGTSGNVRIEYSTNGGSSWQTVVSSTADDGSHQWHIAGSINSTQCRVKITDVSDSNCNDQSNSNFTIAPGCNITVNSPNGGETWEPGSTHPITWSSANTSGNVKIEYSTNGGSSWQMIVSSTADDGSYQWHISGNINSTKCRVKITDVSDNTCYDESNANFTIAKQTTPSMTITSPNGGETWQSPSTQTITWSSSNTSGSVKLEYSTNYNGSANWIPIANNVTDNGSFAWNIPADINSTNCRVKISDAADAGVFDISDGNFTISSDGFKNLLVNGDFSNGDTGWYFFVAAPAQATGSVVNGEYLASITHGGTEDWHIRLVQSGLLLENGKKYIVSFEAYATGPRKIATGSNKIWTGEWIGYHYLSYEITTEKRKYKGEFEMNQPTDQKAEFYFDLGNSTENVYIDNVILREKQITGKLENGDFSNGDEYWLTNFFPEADAYGSVQNGEYLLSIENGGTQSYHIQLMQTDLLIEQGKNYTVSLDAYAEGPREISVSVGQSDAPWMSYHPHQTINLTTTWQTFSYSFTMTQPTDLESRLLFDCGLSALDVHLDNIVLTDAGSNVPLYQNNFDQSLTNTSEPEVALPTAYRLLQSHPNPFNLETTIGYHLTQPAEVVLTIYNSQGHVVRRLVNGNHAAGIHFARWDGRNETGQVVASGLYFYRLEVKPTEAGQPPFVDIKKMILMK